MKNYPKLRFFIDEKEEKANNTLDIISRLSAEMKAKSPLPKQKVNEKADEKVDESVDFDEADSKNTDDGSSKHPMKKTPPPDQNADNIENGKK